MELLNIKSYTHDWKELMKEQIQESGKTPSLSIYQVGDVEASNRYVKNKIKDCEEVGIKAILKKFPEDVSNKELIRAINADESDGIIVQLPLPKQIDTKLLTEVIPVEKDVDGFNEKSRYMCCTPGGIIRYLEDCGFRFDGANAVVIGRSDIVGKPMAKYLLDKNCTVTICHSHTSKSYLYTLLDWADVIVCAVGKKDLFRASDINPKTIAIDVGINFDENGKLCGDINNDIHSDMVTPVPGGVGLLTRCMLLQNTIQACLGV